ncbi:uncharacterized protein LOC116214937 isoform X4 [Punica granatum]|uniref:Uncharacterized protein LOC116214937 isoform X4 n=1 Tax=Punica granatum TaxID=22663 RepID=A0A6P8E8H8_PUNGR|nr:uncharacterized protein LOC116214937 isoform X4 [Punica granatum]XP_031406313.1 uncharacterized protein LOC116214937 isoform X4 [Punica granatum]
MEDEKNAFYVVRKGDVIGIYRNLLDCQDQAGSSISSPSVSVDKGYHLSNDTEDYLKSQGLKNALYTINAADVKDDIFSQLVPCPFQQPSSSGGVQFKEPPAKRSGEMLQLDSYQVVGATSILVNSQRKQLKPDNTILGQVSCTLEFDGASRGNPGLAGAGAVLRAENGTVVHRLREGVGIATNNVAEYRGLILGLRYALERGFKNIRVQGDSKLVCMQVQGLWKIKNQNMANLCKVAKELKEKFASFEIKHVLREFNSEADAQANLAVNLRDGQVEVTCNRK